MSDGPLTAALTAVAYVPDLMDRSRLSTAAAASDPPIMLRFATTPAALLSEAASADAAVVDLGRTEVLDQLAALASAVPVVAFGSHVDRDRLDAARSAGCRLVMARSKFFADVSGALVGVVS